MNIVRLLPVIASFLLLGAHFLRVGYLPLVLLSVAAPFLLFVRRRWVVRLVQTMLILGGIEWVRTLLVLSSSRRAVGEPWSRLAVILCLVAIVTFLSAFVFRARSLRARYTIG
jgi:hypothetical protein